MRQKNASDFDSDRDRHMQGLLRSAGRYVEGYADNQNNHPQARDGARQLLAKNRIATGDQSWICGGCQAALSYEEVQTHKCPDGAKPLT